ncbi:hypothetical protein LTR53_012212 [Teratosphaeriaceae sp. CCFEE 6253]|nr:hypothetical protein LTR53_012212 [Teratosphaeriaceae sp. CCFEE 6253]
MHFAFAMLAIVASAAALVPAPLEDRATNNGKPSQAIVKLARKQVGKPYVWGGGTCNGPEHGGFDCSGLNEYVVCQVSDKKYDLPNHAQTQYNKYKTWGGKRIPWKDAKPGDMFYYSHNSNDCKNDVSHTNIKATTDTVINAPTTGRDIYEGDSSWYFNNNELRICPWAIRFWD